MSTTAAIWYRLLGNALIILFNQPIRLPIADCHFAPNCINHWLTSASQCLLHLKPVATDDLVMDLDTEEEFLTAAASLLDDIKKIIEPQEADPYGDTADRNPQITVDLQQEEV